MKLILVILIAETSMAECRAIKAASTLSNVVSAAGNFLSSRRKTQPLALTAAAADAPAKASRLARVAEGATNGAMAVTSLATLFTSISGFVKPAEVVTPKVVAPAENADGITHQDIFRIIIIICSLILFICAIVKMILCCRDRDQRAHAIQEYNHSQTHL